MNMDGWGGGAGGRGGRPLGPSPGLMRGMPGGCIPGGPPGLYGLKPPT